MKRIVEKLLAAIALISFSTAHSQLLSVEALDTTHVYHSIEEALVNPNSVYRLDLSRNRLKDFPVEILQFTNLNELKLDRNRILTIPDEISKLKYLQHLSISRNALDTLGKSICTLENLRYLNLSDNFITGIAEDIQDLEQLEVLILWMNPIEFIPTEIGMLENLKELDLLHIDLNAEEQDLLRNILPNCYIHFSPPCNCTD